MLISEIYLSRQGEGRLTGTPSVFVRTSGCNLRCDFCDTPFTSWNAEGEQLSIEQIVENVQRAAEGQLPPKKGVEDIAESSTKHVVLTGGEPMIAGGVKQLCGQLAEMDFHVTIETAGTVFKDLYCDLISISPKLSNSTPSEAKAGRWSAKHANARFRPDIVAALIAGHDWQLKFVVENKADIEEIEDYLAAIESADQASRKLDRSMVLLMPEGVDDVALNERARWMKSICDERGFTFCQRKHIFWYGNKRAT